jgi:hypothetical protein
MWWVGSVRSEGGVCVIHSCGLWLELVVAAWLGGVCGGGLAGGGRCVGCEAVGLDG